MSLNWDSLHQKAKTLEARLEKRIQNYSSIAQKISGDVLCDEENPLIDSKDEHAASSEIERDLTELYDCIQHMRTCNGGSLSNHQEVLIKRYYEIHFDYSTEFKNASAAVQHQRDNADLLQQSSRNAHTSSNSDSSAQDSSFSKLLREKAGIAAALRSTNDVLSQAFETRDTLLAQRHTLTRSAGGLSGLSATVPGFERLIDGIQNLKKREQVVLALVLGVLLCITIW